jgi:predicted Holliday junction resolvase-like endonuclease
MIWLVLLVVLVVLFLAVMFWQPSKAKSLIASMPSFPSIAPASPQQSERDKILTEDLEIISEALKASEIESRKVAAMDRIKQLTPKAIK